MSRATGLVPRPSSAAGPVGLLVALLLLAGCGNGQSTGDEGFVSGDGSITRLAQPDRPTPDRDDVVGESLEGEPLRLSDYAGQVVVLNVWGSWCGPCRKEAPLLAETAREFEGKGVRFLGINSRDQDPAQARAFQRRFKIDYPSFYDESGRILLAFRDVIPPKAIPSTLVLDKRGRVAARVLGDLDGRRTLAGLVEEVLAE